MPVDVLVLMRSLIMSHLNVKVSQKKHFDQASKAKVTSERSTKLQQLRKIANRTGWRPRIKYEKLFAAAKCNSEG